MSQVQLEATNTGSSDATSQPLLQVSDLSVHFTKSRRSFGRAKSIIKAVDNVSFSVEESEVVSIVGESGSGKTTVARCILGLTSPTRGSIMFRGSEITNLSQKDLINYRRNVQIIYQDPYESLNPRHDVFTTLALPLKNLLGIEERDRLNQICCSLLEEVGLNPEEMLERYPHQLSGGQRQRVNVARALAPNPKLLIADEPITMLDAAQKLNLLSLLLDLKQKRKLTIILITHDLASSRLISERTFVMYLGRIVEIGATGVILTKPSHPYVERILDATPSLTKESNLDENDSIAWIEESAEVKQGCVYRPRCKYANDVCTKVDPVLGEMGQNHYAACHNPINRN